MSAPAKIGLTPLGLETLRVIHRENLAGSEPTAAALAALQRKNERNMVVHLATLRLKHLVEPDAVRPTALGIDVAEGRVEIERPQRPVLGSAAAIRRPLASSREPLPAPRVPALPPAIAGLRGIVHPSPPAAYPPPPGVSRSTWDALTVVRSPYAARES